jgi:hypothetical protein
MNLSHFTAPDIDLVSGNQGTKKIHLRTMSLFFHSFSSMKCSYCFNSSSISKYISVRIRNHVTILVIDLSQRHWSIWTISELGENDSVIHLRRYNHFLIFFLIQLFMKNESRHSRNEWRTFPKYRYYKNPVNGAKSWFHFFTCSLHWAISGFISFIVSVQWIENISPKNINNIFFWNDLCSLFIIDVLLLSFFILTDFTQITANLSLALTWC